MAPEQPVSSNNTSLSPEQYSLIQGLNPRQAAAVIHGSGPLLVLAGAGSGKTRVLTHRIAALLQTGLDGQAPVWPSQVLAVTFTNKAAREMNTRIAQLVGESQARELWMGTFHSLCARFLRRDIIHYKSAAGRTWKQNFVIYDETETVSIVRGIIKQMGLDEKLYPAKSLRYQISDAKNLGLCAFKAGSKAKDFQSERFATVFDAYEQALSQNNALDFDDLLLTTVHLFEQQPELLANYHSHFRHLLVDEFQDTNEVQYQLIRQLATGESRLKPKEKDTQGRPVSGYDWTNRSLTVVGDADQSIYSWRGANFRILLGFQQDFPEGARIDLIDNYRSTKTILDVANRIIENNNERLPKELRSTKGQGQPVLCYEAYDERDEALYIIDKLQFTARQLGKSLNDCSILYRTNVQSRAMEDVLIAKGIPYRMIGGLRFYERREIRDVLAYLTILFNPDDGAAIKRVINVPKRGIGGKTIEALDALAYERKTSLLEAVLHASQQNLIGGKAGKELGNFVALIARLQEREQSGASVDELVLDIRSMAGYDAMLSEADPDDSEGRLANLDELINVVKQFYEQQPEGTLGDFLAQMALLSDLDAVEGEDAPEERLTLMTIHGSKGLEFPIVALVGLEEGLFPHNRSLNDAEQMEEERRLMYVAVTRAEESLMISYARRRQVFGDMRYSVPSRFLKEIPRELMTGNFRLDSDTESARTGDYDSGRFARSTFAGRAKPAAGGAKLPQGLTTSSASGSFNSHSGLERLANKGGPGKLAIGNLSEERTASASPTKNAEPLTTESFKVGDRIFHEKFGEGSVAQVIGNGGKALYNIQFDKLSGKKLLDPRYAKLQLRN